MTICSMTTETQDHAKKTGGALSEERNYPRTITESPENSGFFEELLG